MTDTETEKSVTDILVDLQAGKAGSLERLVGPTEPVDPLEFLVRLVTHTPDPGQVRQCSDGWYASRTRSSG